MSTNIKSFFDRQKCDLSDKSNEGEERKKVRESSLNTSLSKDDTYIFEEGIDPHAVLVFYIAAWKIWKKR